MDDWNRIAIKRVMTDAKRTLALITPEEIRGNRDLAIASARQNYTNLVRRSERLHMTEEQHAALQTALERLKARLRSLGASVQSRRSLPLRKGEDTT